MLNLLKKISSILFAFFLINLNLLASVPKVDPSWDDWELRPGQDELDCISSFSSGGDLSSLNVEFYQHVVNEASFALQLSAAGLTLNVDLALVTPKVESILGFQNYKRNPVVIEVGGGYGRVVDFLAASKGIHYKIIVFEQVPQLAAFLTDRYSAGNDGRIQVISKSFLTKGFMKKADVIYAAFAMVLELNSIANLKLFFKRAEARLKSTGLLFVDLPNEVYENSKSAFKITVTTVAGGKKILFSGLDGLNRPFFWQGFLPSHNVLLAAAAENGFTLAEEISFKKRGFPERSFFIFRKSGRENG